MRKQRLDRKLKRKRKKYQNGIIRNSCSFQSLKGFKWEWDQYKEEEEEIGNVSDAGRHCLL